MGKLKKILAQNSKLTVLFFFIAAGIFSSYLALAAENKIEVDFPVAELDNCQDEESCRAFCDQEENMDACLSFAEQHNLLSQKEVARARDFSEILKKGGPGDCRSKTQCESYCEDINHLNECLAFVEERKIMPPRELAEAKKVAKAIQAGALPPGNCASKAACEAYCLKPAHSEECLAFAEKAGFISAAEAREAKKILSLMIKGETPGGCTSKKQCESYCAEENHFRECVDFAEKAGLMSSEKAAIVRETGGQGPGGCRSKETCEEFCNNPKNQKICFEFAQKHDLIPPEELAKIKEGMGRLRAGISQAPPEVVNCLKDNMGNDIIEKIEKGTLVPGPDIGRQVEACFQKHLPQLRDKIKQSIGQASPKIKECLDKNLGTDLLRQIEQGEPPTPETGDKIKACFEEIGQKMMAEGRAKIREALNSSPAEVRDCFINKAGSRLVQKIQNGEDVAIGPEIGEFFRQCAEQFQEKIERQKQKEAASRTPSDATMPPPEILGCLEQVFGSGIIEKMKKGEFTPPPDMEERIAPCVRQKMMPTAPTN